MLRHIIFIFFISLSFKLVAVRPFITDDARVVGWRLAQYETWLRYDKHAFQHWNMFAYGPHKKWELALGFVHGLEIPSDSFKSYSYAFPLVQAKFLLNEYKPNKMPGIAIAAGTFLPGGKGTFKAPGYGAFSYLALTQSLGRDDHFLFHANLGMNYVKYPTKDYTVATWGLGTQIKLIGGLHFMGEVFSGDPYVPGSGVSYQTGVRHFISDWIQLDLTVGKGLAGDNQLPLWGSAGIRIVTDKLKKKKSTPSL